MLATGKRKRPLACGKKKATQVVANVVEEWMKKRMGILASGFAKYCSWHRNFQLSVRIFHNFLEFCTRWISGVNTTQFSSVVELRFFDGPLLLLSSLRRYRHIFPCLWPQSVWPGGRLLSCQSLSRPCISIWWFFVQYCEPCETLSMYLTILDLHQCSNNRRYFPNIASKGVSVVLVTSKKSVE